MIKTGYIDLKELYNKFDLKKEMERKLSSMQAFSNNFIDSLDLEIMALSKQSDQSGGKNVKLEDMIKEQKRQYLVKKAELEDRNKEMAVKYDEQIWNQLNQYISDYGETNHYQYVFGVQGTGSIMYASKQNNITEDVVSYVNQRFHGKK